MTVSHLYPPILSPLLTYHVRPIPNKAFDGIMQKKSCGFIRANNVNEGATYKGTSPLPLLPSTLRFLVRSIRFPRFSRFSRFVRFSRFALFSFVTLILTTLTARHRPHCYDQSSVPIQLVILSSLMASFYNFDNMLSLSRGLPLS